VSFSAACAKPVANKAAKALRTRVFFILIP
jgi:hypothetical protein